MPEEVEFRTKPEIALDQIAALAADPTVPGGVVLPDAGYGDNTACRRGLEDVALFYVAGILSTTSVWAPRMAPLPPAADTPRGREKRSYGVRNYEGMY